MKSKWVSKCPCGNMSKEGHCCNVGLTHHFGKGWGGRGRGEPPITMSSFWTPSHTDGGTELAWMWNVGVEGLGRTAHISVSLPHGSPLLCIIQPHPLFMCEPFTSHSRPTPPLIHLGFSRPNPHFQRDAKGQVDANPFAQYCIHSSAVNCNNRIWRTNTQVFFTESFCTDSSSGCSKNVGVALETRPNNYAMQEEFRRKHRCSHKNFYITYNSIQYLAYYVSGAFQPFKVNPGNEHG